MTSYRRREFLAKLSRYLAGAATIPPLLHISPSMLGAEKPPSLLTHGKGEDYAALLERVLKPFGGMKSFVKPGQTVVVKPNIGWDRTPEQAANTNPHVVEAVVRSALSAGAKSVKVFDRTCNDERYTYKRSGIKDAVQGIDSAKVQCSYIDKRKFTPVRIKKGRDIKEWRFYRDALEADVYINLPIAKDHGLANLTLGLKNIMGIIGGDRGRIHQNIGQRLADLNTVIRPALTIIDASRILTDNGPRGGSQRDVEKLDTLIAAVDPVAADAFATTLFDRKIDDVSSTVAAHAMGLGEKNLRKLEIEKV